MIPDIHLYDPMFKPWNGHPDFTKHHATGANGTLVSPERCHVIISMLRNCINIPGEVVECGVYKGGILKMMDSVLRHSGSNKTIYAFDTFTGMPDVDETIDEHRKGDFKDTSCVEVEAFVNSDKLITVQGLIPDSFSGLEQLRFCMAHVDVDIYKSVLESTKFIWPRLHVGGAIVFDDYGFHQCYGARLAIDEFFSNTNTIPLVLGTGQAIAFKSHL